MAHKRSPLRLVPEAAPQPAAPQAPRRLGAVELVPGRVRAAVLSTAGRILDRTESSYEAATATPEDIDAALAGAAEVFHGHELQGIGVAAAGLVDPVTGLIMEVNDPGHGPDGRHRGRH
ncbi:hypothetical protein ABZ554_43940, partial [Streptomyces sp. NPDC020125]